MSEKESGYKPDVNVLEGGALPVEEAENLIRAIVDLAESEYSLAGMRHADPDMGPITPSVIRRHISNSSDAWASLLTKSFQGDAAISEMVKSYADMREKEVEDFLKKNDVTTSGGSITAVGFLTVHTQSWERFAIELLGLPMERVMDYVNKGIPEKFRKRRLDSPPENN